jgi:transposase
MAMGNKTPRQEPLFVASGALAQSPGHPFYERVNGLLGDEGFDRFCEGQCARFYAETMGRPGTPPGVYFRMLMVGYFEGLSSERAIAWRCADSLALRGFLGCGLDRSPPDHSTLSRTRRLIDLETHSEVFGWILALLVRHGLVDGKTLSIDATTLEANAAMRTIVRRADGQDYQAFLAELAQASGIATPTREQLAKLDKRRKGKASNDDWTHPHDPDARITKMKDGTTHLAYKQEQAVDLSSGAIVAVTVQPADRSDTESLSTTLVEASEQLAAAAAESIAAVVTDKGYHSNETLELLAAAEIRAYVSEPKRGRRRWIGKLAAKAAVYANRRRLKSEHAKWLHRRRAEVGERSFAHQLETGGLRRVHVRHAVNVAKRVLIQAATANLGLLMRSLTGIGTPRSLQGRLAALLAALCDHLIALLRLLADITGTSAASKPDCAPSPAQLAAA